jgi:hypothetical protein
LRIQPTNSGEEPYIFGPSIANAIKALGGDPENAIDPDDDPELRPYFIK